eukprot:1715692-Rhodomonas_salina.2
MSGEEAGPLVAPYAISVPHIAYRVFHEVVPYPRSAPHTTQLIRPTSVPDTDSARVGRYLHQPLSQYRALCRRRVGTVPDIAHQARRGIAAYAMRAPEMGKEGSRG